MEAATITMRGHLRTKAAFALATALAITGVWPAQAKITQLVLKTTTSPALGGMSFDAVGQYEQLDGTAYGEIDPNDPANAVIQDIALAPRNEHGMVAYSMDVSILKPINEANGNHVLLYDVVNRGNKVVSNLFNVGATTANLAGDGFLEKQGYSIVWSGWQGDLVPAAGQLGISVPVASFGHDNPITGLVRSEFTTLAVPTAPVTTQNLTAGFSSNTPGYQAVDLDTTHAVLTKRLHQDDPPQTVSPPVISLSPTAPARLFPVYLIPKSCV